MDSFSSFLAAPVTGRGEVLIDAPPARVFSLLADVLMWPVWDRAVDHTAAHGRLGPDAAFEWLAGEQRVAAKVRAFEPGRRIAWSARMIGHRELTIWDLEAEGEGTRARLEESRAGVMPTLLQSRTRRVLQGAVDTRLLALKAAAEKRMPRAA